MRYTLEFKESVINYNKTHTIIETIKRFDISRNTIIPWIRPKEYQEYRAIVKKRIRDRYNEDEIYRKRRLTENKGYTKTLSEEERAKLNTKRQAYKKNRKLVDKEYRDHINAYNVAINKNRYKTDEKYREDCCRRSKLAKRKRRAIRNNIKEVYTKEDEEYTRITFLNECANCGSTDNLCIDHHFPISKGYALSKTNAVLLCRTCNGSKSSKFPEQFYTPEKLQYITEKLKSSQTDPSTP